MKTFQANYVLANPKFYILNLVDSPIDTVFSELLNDIKKNLELTYPSIMSGYLKREIGNIAAFPNYGNPADDFKKIAREDISDHLSVTKLVPTAIMRFQILLLELLKNNYLQFESHWTFNILLPNQKELEIFENITYREEMYGTVQVVGLDALHLAIMDLHQMLNDLLPSELKLPTPFFSINKTIDVGKFVPSMNTVTIDFSLFDTLEQDQMRNPDTIYLRTDFGDTL
ncbi:hypothetical protein [Daejeonella sp.]|jgi:hypothetical protein|uniref:hypothetical protein n=1 Tax=Daejeonella sp. TaxID=2805397 RepID=UPI0037850949